MHSYFFSGENWLKYKEKYYKEILMVWKYAINWIYTSIIMHIRLLVSEERGGEY